MYVLCRIYMTVVSERKSTGVNVGASLDLNFELAYPEFLLEGLVQLPGAVYVLGIDPRYFVEVSFPGKGPHKTLEVTIHRSVSSQ